MGNTLKRFMRMGFSLEASESIREQSARRRIAKLNEENKQIRRALRRHRRNAIEWRDWS